MNAKLMKNPLAVFETKSSEDPIAIHVRRKFLGGSSADDRTAQRQVERILKGRGKDGTWGGSVPATIQALFGLWLLDYKDDRTAAALDWLLQTDRPVMASGGNAPDRYDGMLFRVGRGERDALNRMRGVPFTRGCGGFVKTGATLLLATRLGQGDAGRLGIAYEGLARVVKARQGRWCSDSCGNNMLQAFAVHPKWGVSAEMHLAAKYLAGRQDADGAWDGGIPFYPTLYALSHVGGKAADAQVAKALKRAAGMQNRDGSFGRGSSSLVNTFMVLTAMRNKGVAVGS